MMARVRWVVPGGSEGACMVANVTGNGIAARKIFCCAGYFFPSEGAARAIQLYGKVVAIDHNRPQPPIRLGSVR